MLDQNAGLHPVVPEYDTLNNHLYHTTFFGTIRKPLLMHHCKQNRHVLQSSALKIKAKRLHVMLCLTAPENVAQAEVDNLDILMLVQEEILGFQIPMHDVHGMNLLQAGNNLMEESACLTSSQE